MDLVEIMVHRGTASVEIHIAETQETTHHLEHLSHLEITFLGQ